MNVPLVLASTRRLLFSTYYFQFVFHRKGQVRLGQISLGQIRLDLLLIISNFFLHRKPVVISFGHCADLTSLSAWEMGVYHCDSLFSDGDDTPWVKLSSVGESFPVQTSTMSSQSSSGSSKASSQASSSRKTNSAPSILVSFWQVRLGQLRLNQVRVGR